ncbi:MAG: helicase-related protein [Candidatus Nealsonbacteria bacterium]
MNKDLTFITNEEEENLLERFKVIVKDVEFFDVLVGYFYSSGFHALYKSLEKTKKVRILIGINTNKEILDSVEDVKVSKQQELLSSHSEVKEAVSEIVVDDANNSEESKEVDEGVDKLREWIRSGKIEIKAYPSRRIHAKLYIMSFSKEKKDIGRVIVGSSNFTQAGLVDNLEFNVELRNKSDYDFALNKFNNLWKDAVDVSKEYIETLDNKTRFSKNITPHELYLKFLYEYFKDDLRQSEKLICQNRPADFKKLEYQEQAVLNAKKILNEYGGVFISDVVGLGKTYISAMLASELDGGTLVIAPPMLLDSNNPGSWRNVFFDFKVSGAEYESRGKLDQIIKRGTDKYKNIFIDEAHSFRTETNITYEKLARICRGKRVILVTATPLNNSPKDILSQIKLFQKERKSTIPGRPDLKLFFSRLEKNVKNLDRAQDYKRYIEITKENAKEIREKVLKHLMVRRTRSEIEKYFGDDLKKQDLKFPEVEKPKEVFYELDDNEDNIFNKTIKLIVKNFKYARYTPLLPVYYNGDITQPEVLSQRNMGRFMKILLVKRLESSFYSFRKSIDRFIVSYQNFLDELERGNVYISKKHINKIFEFIENDDDKAIQRLIDQEKAEKYPSKDFSKEFKKDLEYDLEILKEIKKLWNGIEKDPKLLKFIDILSSEPVLKEKKNKVILFTESKETAEYLAKNLQDKFKDEVILFTGQSGASVREKVIENFDAKARFPKDDYRILIATEVLSEGVNLHRSNIVINYDIPWNPTRLMQRVGRVNRVDTKFDKIYTFNFFPTKQANDQIKLQEAAMAKINAFITLLGADAKLLMEGEAIESHELWNRLTSKDTITGEDNSEESDLKYLQAIKEIRKNNPNLFDRIIKLPKKAQTAKMYKEDSSSLLTYFRKGSLQKFFIADNKGSQELDFNSTARLLEADVETKKIKRGKDFYELLDINKEEFKFSTIEDMPEMKKARGRDSSMQVYRILKVVETDIRQLTEEQRDYYKRVIKELKEGGLPKETTKRVLQELDKIKNELNALKVVAMLEKNIPEELLKEHFGGSAARTSGPREVILSEYLLNN